MTRLLGLLAVICSCAPAIAAEPTINLVQPTGGQRGTQVEVAINGLRLNDAQQIIFYEPGLEVTKLEAGKPTQVKVQVKISPEIRLGMHAFRVRTATGVSNLLTFAVGALPEAAEVEPNNDFAAPQAVPLGTTVNGLIKTEDVDYFAVDAKKGDRITAELEGLRLGLTFFDPSLAILDSKRFELARSDDAPLLRQDSLCSIIAPADGRYIVRVRESSFGGDDRSFYRLHVGRFPRPTGLLPAGGKPGETVEVTWLGVAGEARKQKVTLPADARNPFPVYASDEQGVAPSPNWIRVNDLAGVVEAEPNNTRDKATPMNQPGAAHGVIGAQGDVDYFKFAAKKGQKLQLRTSARKTLRSPLDAVVRVRDAKGKSIISNDDNNNSPDSFMVVDIPADGEYFIEIHDHLRAGGADFGYRIELAPPKPTLIVQLPEKVQYQAVTLAVPRGNRMALLMQPRRFNFGGKLELEFQGLPKDVTVEVGEVPANRTDVPVLFTAPAGAPLDGKLVDIIARSIEGNVQVEGRLAQRTMLARGQNNRDMWGHTADRMAAVVTNEAPFHIDIVQPKVPLVRDGSMQLKVVVRRAEGFNEPIALRMLYNPSGVSSSAAIVIPKDKNEALIPITANGSAAISQYKIAVLGRAKVGDGQVEVSSQLADLAIADRFFDFAFERAAVERGQATQLVVNITHKAPFDGAAKIQVVGLPKGITADLKEITKDTKQLMIPLKTTTEAVAGEHKTLVCQATVTQQGEPILHRMYGAQLRVNKPLPPKATNKPKPKPKPAATAAKKPKPLSRLEQLRQESNETP